MTPMTRLVILTSQSLSIKVLFISLPQQTHPLRCAPTFSIIWVLRKICSLQKVSTNLYVLPTY